MTSKLATAVCRTARIAAAAARGPAPAAGGVSHAIVEGPISLAQATQGLDRVDHGRRVAVVSGAGPTGLASAIALKNDGFDDVIVFDKRPTFTRNNFVNLRQESLDGIARLGAFKSLRASQADLLRERVHVDRPRGTVAHTPANPIALRPHRTFDPATDFKETSKLTVSLAELQHVLNEVAVDAGVVISTGTEMSLQAPDAAGFYGASLRHGDTEHTIRRPELIVVAEGGSSATRDALGIEMESKSPVIESWVIGTLEHRSDEARQILLVSPPAPGQGEAQVSNCIVNSKRGEVNVAVTVPVGTQPDAAEARALVQARGAQALAGAAGTAPVDPSTLPVRWLLAKPVDVVKRKAREVTRGANVVVAGDAAGTGSPLAGLGVNLGTSAYVGAISTLCHELHEGLPRDACLERYARTVSALVDLWHARGDSMAADMLGRGVVRAPPQG